MQNRKQLRNEQAPEAHRFASARYTRRRLLDEVRYSTTLCTGLVVRPLALLNATMNAEQANRSILALNNLGVALLERQAFMQAFETLRTAITAAAYAVELNRSHTTDEQWTQMIDQAMESANQRFFSPIVKHTAHKIRSLSCDSRSFVDLGTGVLRQLDPAALYPIRIEAGEEVNVDLVSAVVVYNTGVAFHALLAANGSSGDRSSALAYYLLANDLLRVCSDHIQTVFMVILIYSASAKVYQDVGEGSSAAECQEHLVRLRSAADEAGLLMEFPGAAGAA